MAIQKIAPFGADRVQKRDAMKKIGIVGTGFVATGAFQLMKRHGNLSVAKILTRRHFSQVVSIPAEYLTNSIDELIEKSDIVLEATGDAIWATDVLLKVMAAELPVITMDSELHVTTGSYFADLGYITEAEGDQPGCLAKLDAEAKLMGFTPWAYINIKGFLNLNPSQEEMMYWAKKQKLRIQQVISFTDGTKLQIEQALVANGLGTTILNDGLTGDQVDDIRATEDLADKAKVLGHPISDYVVSPKSPPGVYLLAENETADHLPGYGPFVRIKTTNKKYFLLLKPYHLCHLEIPKTIQHVLDGEPPLLNNTSDPHVGVAAIVKKQLARGDVIERGVGSFKVRGRAVKISENPDYVPICLLTNARLKRTVAAGEQLSFDDVELPESNALEIFHQIMEKKQVRSFTKVQ